MFFKSHRLTQVTSSYKGVRFDAPFIEHKARTLRIHITPEDKELKLSIISVPSFHTIFG